MENPMAAVPGLVEGQAVFDALHVGLVDQRGLRILAFLFRAFGTQQVAFIGRRTENFPSSCDFKALRRCFLGFTSGNGFRHKRTAKIHGFTRGAIIMWSESGKSASYGKIYLSFCRR